MADHVGERRNDAAATRQFSILVCYDIAGDDRRADLSDLLMGYGPRVQLSVFECRVRGSAGVAQLRARIEELIDPLEDQVRIYNFGARHAAPAILGSRTLEEWRDYVIV